MRHVAYIGHLLAFAFAGNPLMYVSWGLSLLSVVIELVAMSVLFPLSSLALGQPISAKLSVVGGSWVTEFLGWIGVGTNLRTVCLLFFAILLIRVGTLLAGQGLTLFLGKRLLAQLSSMAFENTVRAVPIKSIEEKSVGYFVTLAGDEAFRASNLVIATSRFIGVAALGTLYFASIAYHSPVAAVLVAGFLMLSFIAMLGSFRESHRLGALQTEQSQLASSIFLDALNGLRAVRAMTAEEYVVHRYRSEIFRYVRTLFRVDLISLLARLAPVALLLSLGILLLWMWRSDREAIDVAFLFVLLMYLMRLFPVVGQALNLFMQVLTDVKAGRDVLAATVAPKERGLPRRRLEEKVNSIAIRDIDFEYAPDKPVLRGLTMDFTAGNSYAIVGSSGSGKSTLLDLVLGFHDPVGGAILINGRSIHEMDLSSLRRRVVLLGQQAAIFNDTVLNNILFGATSDQSVVEHASRIACLDEVVKELPDGYDTKLAYQGSNLSGGQKQRIGLARALVRQPDVLVLDESTNALDRETRLTIVDSILKEYLEKIVIFITHDHEIAGLVNKVFDLETIAQNSTANQSLA